MNPELDFLLVQRLLFLSYLTDLKGLLAEALLVVNTAFVSELARIVVSYTSTLQALLVFIHKHLAVVHPKQLP